jgi:hypothetical protein
LLDIMTAAPKKMRIGVREFLVGPFMLQEFGVLQAWIRENGVPPLKRLEEELKIAPEEEHRRLRYEAWVEQRDDWPPAPYSNKGAKILFADTPGIRYFLELFLRKHNEVSEQEISAIMKGIGMAELDTMVMIAYGSQDLDPEEAWATAMGMRRREPKPTASSSPGAGPHGDSGGPGENGSTPATQSLLTNSPTN